MSPEQAQDPRNAHAASDQYTLGVILVECVTGRRAFEGRSLYPVLRSIVTGDMPRPRSLRPELPEAFEAVLLRATSVDISARYDSVDDLARALLPFAPRHSRDSWRPVFRAEAEPDAEAARAAPTPPPTPTTPPAVVSSVDDLDAPIELPLRPRSRGVTLAGLAALAALALALGWWTLRPAPPPTRAAAASVRLPAPPAEPAVAVASPPPVVAPVATAPVVVPAPVVAPTPRPTARAARPPNPSARRQLGANGAPIEE
jgi:serine/threonine-protein kinase